MRPPSSITYMGPVSYSGNISLRSESSAGSARSFAFPVLQTEWHGSPVRMARADQRRLRKNRGWLQANVTQKKNVTVEEVATKSRAGSVEVEDSVEVGGIVEVGGKVEVGDRVEVDGWVEVNGRVKVDGRVEVGGGSVEVSGGSVEVGIVVASLGRFGFWFENLAERWAEFEGGGGREV
ncbi:hypothetical protein Droror1_Dr00021736 [Drosera rotundifolia]